MQVMRRATFRLRTYLLRLRPLWWSPRRRRVLVYVIVLAAAGALAATVVELAVKSPNIDKACGRHPFSCGVGSSAVGTAGLALVVSLFWIGLVEQQRIVRRYRRRVLDNPAQMIDGAHEADYQHLVGRTELVSDILDELRSSRRVEPVVVVGESGSGKTAILLMLAHHLAVKGLVPVFLSLRGVQLPQQLEHEASDRFVMEVDVSLRARDLGDRIWRRLRRASRLVLVVDALDEAFHVGPSAGWSHAVRRTFGEVLKLPTVVTSRPGAVPDGLPCARFQVPPLSLDEIQETLRQRLRIRGTADADLKMLVSALGADSVPFFIDIVAQIPDPMGTVGVTASQSVTRNRRALLRAWLGPELAEHGLGLGILALAFMELGSYEAPTGVVLQAAARLGENSTRILEALDFGLSSGVLRRRHQIAEELVYLRHPLLLVFLVGELAVRDWARVEPVLRSSPLPEGSEALAWASLDDVNTALWLDRAASLSHGSAAASAIARVAAEAGAGLPTNFQALVSSTEWLSSDHKRELLRSLPLSQTGSIARTVLLDLLDDPSYAVRWQAASLLAVCGDSDDTIAAWLTQYASDLMNPESSASRSRLLQERGLWFGPGLAHHPSAAQNAGVAAAIGDLAQIVIASSRSGEPGSPGAESSLAQGIKLAASRGAPPPAVPVLEYLVRDARFWFARFESVAAVAHYARTDRTPLMLELVDSASHDEHPLVRAGARSALRSLKDDEEGRWLWHNEREAVEDPALRLQPEALLLLADVVMLLNLGAQGSQQDRDRVATCDRLPLCMRESRERSHLLEARLCPNSCGMRVCPYPISEADYWNRGHFPEAFCRAVRHAAQTIGPPEWFDGSVREYCSIWRQLEEYVPSQKRAGR